MSSASIFDSEQWIRKIFVIESFSTAKILLLFERNAENFKQELNKVKNFVRIIITYLNFCTYPALGKVGGS